MFKKILLPTDGSPPSAKAISGAVEFARTLGASIVGVTVMPPYSYANMSEYRPEAPQDYEARVAKIAAERLSHIANAGSKAGVNTQTLTAESFSPHEAIIKAAIDHGCDVIFMASHGRRGLDALLLGSETQKVLTHSAVPVLVYR